MIRVFIVDTRRGPVIDAPCWQDPESFALLVSLDEVAERSEGEGEMVKARGGGDARCSSWDRDNCNAVVLIVVP